MTTLAQQRSAFALEQLGNVNQDREGFKKLVLGLPAMILGNGFGQTLAFLLAKGTDRHLQAFTVITNWLRARQVLAGEHNAQVMREISHLPQHTYLQAQEEALALLEWVKRYADAGLFGQP